MTGSAPLDAVRIRVGVISADRGMYDRLKPLDAMFVEAARASSEPERLACDALLLDVRDRHRHLEATGIVARSQLPLLVYGPTGDPQEAMRYLDLGADDYVTEFTTARELLARIRSVVRYSPRAGGDWLLAEGVSISLRHQEVRRNGEVIHLTPNEYRLLEALASRAGDVRTHRELILAVWGPEFLSAHHYVRVFVRQLREKLEIDPAQPRIIETVKGRGYRLVGSYSAERRGVG
jgi:two-component system KDP operon response regulator KdpE